MMNLAFDYPEDSKASLSTSMRLGNILGSCFLVFLTTSTTMDGFSEGPLFLEEERSV